VRVPDRRGDGWTRAIVQGATDKPKGFETKALLGLAPKLGGGGLFDGD
jgi:hypothetical protein